ncbi:MAG: aldo/keto reductase [Planctomycetota bacterium]|jgi:diketogulonate reductase-like aldo/keto reductase|nr:aldo/keto reductase [Planctomycetota bacterium]
MAGSPLVTLNDGKKMPQLGLGVWQINDSETATVVKTALALGYRSVDTAAFYKNERGVGEGVRLAQLPREEVFVTTKLWNSRHGYDEALKAFEESMTRLDLGYLDLFLIHWPVAGSLKYVDTWKAFVKLRQEGRVKSIGVSNFNPDHLKRIVDATGVKPVVNQVELHPLMQQKELRAVHAELGIATEAWSPLGKGTSVNIPEIVKIATKYGKTSGQVIIRWHLDSGTIVIPKSANPQRLADNLNVFDFRLDPADMTAMAALDKKARMDMDPAVFTGLDLT